MPSDSSTFSGPTLRVCLLWHQHQPDYRLGNRFLLPWAWLHATKDYLEMAQHIEAVPGMRATINLTPILLKQIEEYLAGSVSDPVLDCMTKPSASLTAEDKRFIIENFFLANDTHMIARSARYSELLDRSRQLPRAEVVDVSSFTEQDFRDLAVHFALAWTGEFARDCEPAKALVAKERGYTEEEKTSLVNYHRQLVAQIVPVHKKLRDKGQLELTTSPYYHPILPLLVDSSVARQQMPEVPLPVARFQYPEDAKRQLETGRSYFETLFGHSPSGLWPSEGSVSEEVLARVSESGYRWVATDERILDRSVERGSKWVDHYDLAKYFPWLYKTPSGPIGIFFRNQWLSDKIGFDYYSLSADDAVRDFIQSLQYIRQNIVAAYGEQGLDAASVNVILDGENCWEFYPENGREFLSKLYQALTTTPGIAPAQFSEVLKASNDGSERTLEHVAAGSWINGNFSIWIGCPEENAAWDALAAARKNFESFQARSNASDDSQRRIALALEELLIAEGSDWFWWYGDKHFSVNQDTFDELFRAHLRAMYVHLDERVPESLAYPISLQVERTSGTLHPSGNGHITPILLGAESLVGWENAISIEYKTSSAMQRATSTGSSEIRIGWDEKEIFLRVLPDEDTIHNIRFEFAIPPGLSVQVERDAVLLRLTEDATPIWVAGRGILRDAAEIAFPSYLMNGEDRVKFAVHVEYEAGRSARLPHADWFEQSLNG